MIDGKRKEVIRMSRHEKIGLVAMFFLVLLWSICSYKLGVLVGLDLCK